MNSIYTAMSEHGYFDGISGVGFLTGLYGDEFNNYSPFDFHVSIYSNNISSALTNVTGRWSDIYNQLYSVNSAIEGLTTSKKLNYGHQWLGEAYFLRGLLYFYLTNLYGNVPLVLSTDYQRNNQLARSPQDEVYKQIISDLQQARSLLTTEYKDDNGLVVTNRGRPNRSSAIALLARANLYNKDWSNAVAMADSVIMNADYQLVDPSETFLVNSKENIWGIVPFQTSSYLVMDASYYFIPNGETPQTAHKLVALDESLVNAFEANDLRFVNWVGVDSVPAVAGVPASVYFFAYKYRATGSYTEPRETVVMLRLAEQYLIRAEARVHSGDLQGTVADLNIIRARAGLQPTTATTQGDLLAAVEKERRVEFFTEDGH
ncbi:MAG TPA: RagB/SusD family nutrient uptake outer membrane protein, partial [Chitinophagaceae bacterium]|nr:RagB/SusD family nutrient uptake outer membrane protein [Chitinophagaceae bacterium]